MSRLTIIFAATAAIAGDLALLPAPVAAQPTNVITVYGTDPCPRSTESAVYVCNRRPESERYRLPKDQQLQGTRQDRQSWANRAQALRTVGNTGPQSCSNVGPGGFTGCVVQSINQAKQENKENQAEQTAPEK